MFTSIRASVAAAGASMLLAGCASGSMTTPAVTVTVTTTPLDQASQTSFWTPTASVRPTVTETTPMPVKATTTPTTATPIAAPVSSPASALTRTAPTPTYTQTRLGGIAYGTYFQNDPERRPRRVTVGPTTTFTWGVKGDPYTSCEGTLAPVTQDGQWVTSTAVGGRSCRKETLTLKQEGPGLIQLTDAAGESVELEIEYRVPGAIRAGTYSACPVPKIDGICEPGADITVVDDSGSAIAYSAVLFDNSACIGSFSYVSPGQWRLNLPSALNNLKNEPYCRDGSVWGLTQNKSGDLTVSRADLSEPLTFWRQN